MRPTQYGKAKQKGYVDTPYNLKLAMNRKGQRSELWKFSYIAYLLELKGINITLACRVLRLSHAQFVRRVKDPKHFTYDNLVKLSQLVNITLFEMVALVDLCNDGPDSRYTAEFYYSEMLKSKTLLNFKEYKRLGLLEDMSPFELYKVLEYYNKKQVEEL